MHLYYNLKISMHVDRSIMFSYFLELKFEVSRNYFIIIDYYRCIANNVEYSRRAQSIKASVHAWKIYAQGERGCANDYLRIRNAIKLLSNQIFISLRKSISKYWWLNMQYDLLFRSLFMGINLLVLEHFWHFYK